MALPAGEGEVFNPNTCDFLMRTLLLEAGIANVLRSGPQPGTCSVNFPSFLLLSFKLLGIKDANERKQKPKSIGAKSRWIRDD